MRTIIAALTLTALACSAAFASGGDPANKKVIEEIRITHELLRGLEYKFEPKVEIVGAREAGARAARLAGRYFPLAAGPDGKAAQAAWKFLRLIPEERDLQGAIDGFARAGARAFYDPETRSVVLASDLTAPGWNSPLIAKTMEVLKVEEPEFALARQFALALLDSNFGIFDKLADPAMPSDMRMAALALLNGDANLMLMDYMLRNYGVKSTLLPNAEGVVSQFIPLVTHIPKTELEAAPQALARDAAFPHTAGAKFAAVLRATGAGPLMDSAYFSLPVSSEQILHPEKFFESRDNPVEVETPELYAALPEGSAKIYEDTLGEWGLRRLLAAWMKDDSEASSAASGWAGDRLLIYELPGGEIAGAFFTVWDSAPDAELFAGVFRRAARAAFAADAHIEVSSIGRDAVAVIVPRADMAPELSGLVWQSVKIPTRTPPPELRQPDPEALITQLSQFMGMFSNTNVAIPPAGEDWRVEGDAFINGKHKYTLRRPGPDWNFQRLHLGNQFVSEFTAVNTKSVGSNFTIFTFNKYSPEERENPVDQMVDFMKAQMQGFKRVEEKTSTVAGAPARSVTFTGSMFVPLKITYTEVFGPDFTHVITWWAVKNNYDSLLPEYMKFMETFRFLD
ncbi:MAG: hypothetical protein BWY28_01740 [bacterium ADurb.Bin236]|nr:MAG: hypothetical protein BWY28_01740 [bacterium ADurb.Bin236]HPN93507.1 hypothetical protein [bacterium]